jgi:hypothetical protein
MSDHNPHWSSHSHTWNPAPITINSIPHMEWVYGKEDEMTTLDKVHKERKEAAERKRIEQTYELLDGLELNEIEDGSVLRFDAILDGKTFTYAALHHGGRWWATGGTAPNGVGLEDLLAWMIRKHVDPATVVTL